MQGLKLCLLIISVPEFAMVNVWISWLLPALNISRKEIDIFLQALKEEIKMLAGMQEMEVSSPAT